MDDIDASMRSIVTRVDETIMERTSFKRNPTAKKFYSCFSCVQPLYYLAVAVYILITQFERPSWCVEIVNMQQHGTDAQKEKYKDFDGWQCRDKYDTIANFDIINLPQVVTLPLEGALLLLLLYFIWMKRQFMRSDADDNFAWTIQRIATFIAICDIIYQVVMTGKGETYPDIASLIRPVIILTLFKSVRETFFKYMNVVYTSLHLGVVIAVFLIYFSWICKNIFKGTAQGLSQLKDWPTSLYSMLTLLTTANYPDVMLPSYEADRTSSYLFVVFLIFSVFLLLNLLLAVVYSRFLD